MANNDGPWALKYVELGWHVLPCHFIDQGACSCGKNCKSPGKHPATLHGCKDATSDPVLVKAIWTDNPDWNIGVATGPVSGIFVVDLDGAEGIQCFEKLGTVAVTPVAETGGGGRHYFFRYPTNVSVRNRTKLNGQPIDVRGKGGYVVAPPSDHVSGNDYEWKVSPLDVQVAEAPQWVLDLVTSEPKRLDPLTDLVGGDLHLETASGVAEGQRHDRAGQLIGAHLGRGEPALDVLEKAFVWGNKCDPPMEEAEIRRLVRDLDAKERKGASSREAVDDPHRLARLVLDQEFRHDDGHTLQFWNNTWHRWLNGAWKLVPEKELRANLSRVVKAEFDRIGPVSSGRGRGRRHVRKVTPGLLHSVLVALESLVLLPGDVEQPCWLSSGPWPADEILVAKNGLIHLPSFVEGDDYLLSHTPRFFTPAALDYEISPGASPPVQWLKFLKQLWPNDDESIATLQQWFGYLLLPVTRQQKMLMIIGPRRSGKGTIGRVLAKMVGRHNVTGPMLSTLAQTFGLWPLVGKMVAIVSDARLDRKVSSVVVERLLSISGEDLVTVEQKYLPSVTMKLPTRFVMLTNELPAFKDASVALASRFVLLKLTQSFFGDEDMDLTEKLTAEMPGILLWAVQGWKDLREQGRFIEPQTSKALRADLEELSSPVATFVQECCQTFGSISRQELYQAYQFWCDKRNRQYVESDSIFGRNLRAVVPTILDAHPREGEGRVRCHDGISLSSDFREEFIKSKFFKG